MATYDYYVSAVGYNSDNTHIAKLRVHPAVEGGKFGAAQEMTRPQVVDLIGKKKTFATITKGRTNDWNMGAPLEIVPVTTKYLKTIKDSTEKDNLENLPTF